MGILIFLLWACGCYLLVGLCMYLWVVIGSYYELFFKGKRDIKFPITRISTHGFIALVSAVWGLILFLWCMETFMEWKNAR